MQYRCLSSVLIISNVLVTFMGHCTLNVMLLMLCVCICLISNIMVLSWIFYRVKMVWEELGLVGLDLNLGLIQMKIQNLHW